MKFTCENENGLKWEGEIKKYVDYGKHYSIEISAKGSGIILYFGRAAFGQWFVAIPDWNAAVIIGNLRDTFYNSEKIGIAMENEIDGLSVAKALYVFAETKEIEEIDGSQEILEVFRKAGFNRIE